jgi:two-component system sensor histidine kinase AlgZ
VLLAVQAAVLLAGCAWAQGWLDAASRAAVAFAGLSGTLLWLPACAPAALPLAAPPDPAAAGLLMLGAGRRWRRWPPGWPLCAGLGWCPGGLVAGVAACWPAPAWPAACGTGWTCARMAAQPVEASARLAELQSRIRPHFLFNTLNTALALVRVDPRAPRPCWRTWPSCSAWRWPKPAASVTLDEEIDLAQRYLAIEQLRFGDRLRLVWDLDPGDAGRARVPPLVLQPLVENAVRHGVEPAEAGGAMHRTRAQRAWPVMVTNTLPDEPGVPGNGIALPMCASACACCTTWRSSSPGARRGRCTAPASWCRCD